MKFEEIIPDTVAYATSFFQSDEALFSKLVTAIPWRQEQIKFGTTAVNLPRLVSWHGEPGARYFYSGIHNEPEPWTEELLILKHLCDDAFPSANFNSVLLNYYRSGSDSIGWHADNEKDLMPGSVIATMSIGGKRTFQLKPKKKDSSEKLKSLIVENGSMLLMWGNCQSEWLHSIPKEPHFNQPRISLTFRTVHIK